MGSSMSSASNNKSPVSAAAAGGMRYSRRAHHAGSWYESDADALRTTLEGFLGEAASSSPPPRQTDGSALRGLIVPHAGYSYSGQTAAHAYLRLRRELSSGGEEQQRQQKIGSRLSPGNDIRSVVVLHPSHHVYMENECALSNATAIETPLGNLQVDDDLRREILQLQPPLDAGGKGKRFGLMDRVSDEEEHSGEMQYPFFAHVLLGCASAARPNDGSNIKVLPIMCGSLSEQSERSYGQMLSKILGRPDVLTVVSTDFCHWGQRFRYKPTPSSSDGAGKQQQQPIHEFIKMLDARGMELIEMREPGAFASYLRETRNTICGRHAVAVYLNAITAAASSGEKPSVEIKFVKYAQSSQVKSARDSSVSYAAAVATAAPFDDTSLPN